MDEVGFRTWLLSRGVTPKVVGDTVSRLKRLEKELGHLDMDEEYRSDQCERVFSALANNGNNDVMKSFRSSNLPIGKYYMSTFRYALKKYVDFIQQKSTQT